MLTDKERQDVEQALAQLTTFNQILTKMQRDIMTSIVLLRPLVQVPVPAEGESPAASEANAASDKTTEEFARVQRAAAQFVGAHSLFYRYLSPEVLTNAVGSIKPEVGSGMQQYSEDVRHADLAKLRTWPSGFYRSQQTKAIQFFVRFQDMMLFVDTSNEQINRPLVVYIGEDGQERPHHVSIPVPILNTPVAEMERIAQELEKFLIAFTTPA